MDFSIQYVMMRTSLGEVLLSDFLCLLQVTQQHRNRVEISNATGRNVGMAQAVNHFFYPTRERRNAVGREKNEEP